MLLEVVDHFVAAAGLVLLPVVLVGMLHSNGGPIAAPDEEAFLLPVDCFQLVGITILLVN